MVRWYFKVLVRSTSLLPKTLMRGSSNRSAPASTSACAGCKGLIWTFQPTFRPAAVPGCSLLDRLPCLRASRTTADLPACCFSARSPPNTTLVGLAAPKRSRFLASAEVPRPLSSCEDCGPYTLDVPRLFYGVAGLMFLLTKIDVRFEASISPFRLLPQLADPTGVEARCTSLLPLSAFKDCSSDSQRPPAGVPTDFLESARATFCPFAPSFPTLSSFSR